LEREHSRELCDFGDSDSLVRLDSTQLPSKGNAIGLFVSSSVQCILLNRSWYLDFFMGYSNCLSPKSLRMGCRYCEYNTFCCFC